MGGPNMGSGPGSILKGYGLKAMPGWPAGFYQGQEAEAVGVVVLRELPERRTAHDAGPGD